MSEDAKMPNVFISYSHDSPEHKRWVSNFAKNLMQNGIEVIFDQWELGYGDEVPKFMEKSVRDADRVLMICTEKYVHKADDGVGGVGYEAMVVTGELVKDLGTSKFIPIIRQEGGRKLLPTSVSTRRFVDLSNDADFAATFEDLLRDLHKSPVNVKPSVGKNPFANSPPVQSKPPLPPPELGQTILEGMVLIPEGPFLYGKKRIRIDILYDYFMDIYPVTNEQFKKFMVANGYGSQRFWSEEGWAWKQKIQVNCPVYWTDPKWNNGDHPVVGVSYYEAEAYASWAGKRLPTEQEWEKAAGGTDGREYPWGDVFDKTKCNSRESGFDATTSVTKYTTGISPFECYDMAGNVWEWCASWYDQSNNRRVVRGGSWSNSPEFLRSSHRDRGTAVKRDISVGFRLAQDTP